MFDGFDAMPLCVAPLLALFVGGLTYFLGLAIKALVEKRNSKKYNLLNLVIALVVVAVVPLVCTASIALEIGSAIPIPWITPAPWDIWGRWELTKCTSNQFREQWNNFSDVPGTIEFKWDGTFTVKNLPALWELNYDRTKSDGEYISGSGIWYIKQSRGRIKDKEWVLYAQFQEVNQTVNSRLIGFYFDGNLPPYSLDYMDYINVITLTKGGFSIKDYLCGH